MKTKKKFIKSRSKLYLISLLTFISVFSITIKAQIAQGYEVATWHQFRTSAITYTFDDNSAKQLTVALPLFNQYDFKVTLFIITNRITNWAGYNTASNAGHEVASHTASHTNLSTLAIADQDVELKQSQIVIKTKVLSSDCVTMSYPNCALGDYPTVQKYYIAARSCAGVIVPKTPTDFNRISSISTGTTTNIQTATQFNNTVNLAKASKGWCVFLTHAIDDESGYSPTQSAELATHLAYVNQNSNDFWVATFENVVKYIRERNAVSISESPVNSDSYLLIVTDNLKDSVYDVPITLRRLLPAAWINVNVSQNAGLIPSTLSTVGNNKYVTFDVIPDKGDITLSKSDETDNRAAFEFNVFKVEPNPFTNDIQISTTGAFRYSLYRLDGSISEQGDGIIKKRVGSDLIPGIYILKIVCNNQTFTAKIIKI